MFVSLKPHSWMKPFLRLFKGFILFFCTAAMLFGCDDASDQNPAGTDENHNGVRDEMDAWINQQRLPPEVAQALTAYARFQQFRIVNAPSENLKQKMHAAAGEGKAIWLTGHETLFCASQVMHRFENEISYDRRNQLFKQLAKRTFNTRARRAADDLWTQSYNGLVFPLIENACAYVLENQPYPKNLPLHREIIESGWSKYRKKFS